MGVSRNNVTLLTSIIIMAIVTSVPWVIFAKRDTTVVTKPVLGGED